MDAALKDWTRFLSRSLEQRIPADLFAAAATQLHNQSPITGQKIAVALLRPRNALSTIDPRVIVYLERLLALKLVDAPDVLCAAFLFSKDYRPAKTSDSNDTTNGTSSESGTTTKASHRKIPSELEEIIFHRLHKTFAAEERPLSVNEGIRTLRVVTRWMAAMVTAHTSESMMQAMAGMQQQTDQKAINIREGLGMLAVGVIENSKMVAILGHERGKDLRKEFIQALNSFIPFLSNQSAGSQTSLQLANRLEISQKQHDLYEKLTAVNGDATESPNLEVAALQLEAVMDLPAVNTRPGLYVFMNALLVARPLTDEFTIINYLQSRYKLEPQNMATDLITAAFDILANAMYRSEPTQVMFSLKSFLANGVPLLLSQLSAAIFPMTPEICITQALSHVDQNAFPAFSQGFDDIMGNSNSLSDVRQDFLNACALHGLIPLNTIERLLGETPMQGPPETKYEKKTILEQCKNNFDKVGNFIDELENLDGNAGAIVGAVTEFISHLCETQMTMYLKQISCMIFKKPQVMDVMLQFTSPASILRPLAQFLDNWHYDSDQGEYQPVYDEFGAILVLVMAFVYRYDLSYHDLGIARTTIVARLIEHGSQSMLPSELSEEQGKALGSWLKGLYDSDKEGLSNDVFASCRPQDFYLIVPTFFHQTVLACSAGVLSFETVKGGLEYLGETFLLPSLIGGLAWMAHYATLQTHNDLDAVMKIFKELILTTPSSGDAQAMHGAILAMVSSRLEKCFRTLQRRDSSQKNIEPLLQAIKGYSQYEHSTYASVKELEQWTNPPHSTLEKSLRHTVQNLSQWAINSAMQYNPPSYTHRQIYASMRLIGTYPTLRAIIDEVKTQTEAGNGAAALDIGVSIICAPTTEDSPIPVDWVASPVPAPQPPRSRTNLRDMLKQEFDDAAALVATDPGTAETIVRLHRRVEAQLSSMSATAAGLHASGLGGVNIADMSAQALPDADALNQAIDDAAVASMDMTEDLSTMDNKALQRSMDELAGPDGSGLDLASMGIATGSGDPAKLNANMGNAGTGLGDLDLGSMGDMDMMDMDMGALDMDMELGNMGGMDGMDGMGGMDMGGGEDDWGLDFENM